MGGCSAFKGPHALINPSLHQLHAICRSRELELKGVEENTSFAPCLEGAAWLCALCMPQTASRPPNPRRQKTAFCRL